MLAPKRCRLVALSLLLLAAFAVSPVTADILFEMNAGAWTNWTALQISVANTVGCGSYRVLRTGFSSDVAHVNVTFLFSTVGTPSSENLTASLQTAVTDQSLAYFVYLGFYSIVYSDFAYVSPNLPVPTILFSVYAWTSWSALQTAIATVAGVDDPTRVVENGTVIGTGYINVTFSFSDVVGETSTALNYSYALQAAVVTESAAYTQNLASFHVASYDFGTLPDLLTAAPVTQTPATPTPPLVAPKIIFYLLVASTPGFFSATFLSAVAQCVGVSTSRVTMDGSVTVAFGTEYAVPFVFIDTDGSASTSMSALWLSFMLRAAVEQKTAAYNSTVGTYAVASYDFTTLPLTSPPTPAPPPTRSPLLPPLPYNPEPFGTGTQPPGNATGTLEGSETVPTSLILGIVFAVFGGIMVIIGLVVVVKVVTEKQMKDASHKYTANANNAG